MNEELDFIIQLAKEKMEESLSHLDKLINIRAGKANPNMLNSIKIDYYGTLAPLSQVTMLTYLMLEHNHKPLEKYASRNRKSYSVTDLVLIMNNGESIIINVPALTEEKRKN